MVKYVLIWPDVLLDTTMEKILWRLKLRWWNAKMPKVSFGKLIAKYRDYVKKCGCCCCEITRMHQFRDLQFRMGRCQRIWGHRKTCRKEGFDWNQSSTTTFFWRCGGSNYVWNIWWQVLWPLNRWARIVPSRHLMRWFVHNLPWNICRKVFPSHGSFQGKVN